MSFAGVAINSSLSKAGRAAVYIGAPVTGFSSMGQTLYSVGSVDGTISISPNQDVVKLYRSDAQNPCHMLETAYDFQVSFNLQEVDVYNLALALGYKTTDAISPTDSLVSSTTAITQGDLFGGTMFTSGMIPQRLSKIIVDVSNKKVNFESVGNPFSAMHTDSVVVLSEITDMATEIHTIHIQTVGSGYSAGTLSATGGGGSGFAATYTVTGAGGIDTITITETGSGYHNEAGDLALVISSSTSGTTAVLVAQVCNLQALEGVELPIGTVASDNSITTDILDDSLFDALNSANVSSGTITIQPQGFGSAAIEVDPPQMGYIRHLAEVTSYNSNNPGSSYSWATTIDFTSTSSGFTNFQEVGEYIVLKQTDQAILKQLLGYPLRVTTGVSTNTIVVDVSDFEISKGLLATNTLTHADSLIKLQMGSDFQAGYRSLLIRVEGGLNSSSGGNVDGSVAVDEWQFWKVKIQSTGSIDYDRTGAVTLPITMHCASNKSDIVGQYMSANDHARSGTYGDSS